MHDATFDLAELDRVELPTAFRGLESHAVRSLLARIAQAWRAEREASETSVEAPGGPVGVPRPSEEQAERLIREARDDAAGTRRRAELERAALVAGARREAGAIESAARRGAAQRHEAQEAILPAVAALVDAPAPVPGVAELRAQIDALTRSRQDAAAQIEGLTDALGALAEQLRGGSAPAGHSEEPPLGAGLGPGVADEHEDLPADAVSAGGPSEPMPVPTPPTPPAPLPAPDPQPIMGADRPLLDPSDLPVRLGAGGPLDPRPGEYLDGWGTGAPSPPDVSTPTPSADLDGLFARIRRGALGPEPPETCELADAAADAPAEAPGAGATAIDATAIDATATDAAVAGERGGHGEKAQMFLERDRIVAEVAADACRRVKRALADDLNDLLDRRRRDDAVPPDGFPGEDHYVVTVRDGLVAAAAGGRALGSPARGVATPPVDDLARAFAAELVHPLRRRVAHVAADAEPDEFAHRVRAVFREWRGEQVESLVVSFAQAAVARGALAGFGAGEPVRWVCDPRHPCAEGADNELAGEVPLGEPFPTGQPAAPAYLGCPCLVVPAGAPDRRRPGRDPVAVSAEAAPAGAERSPVAQSSPRSHR